VTAPRVESSEQEWVDWVYKSTHAEWQEMSANEYVDAYNRAALQFINNEYDTRYSVVPGKGIIFEFHPRYDMVIEAVQRLKGPPATVLDVGCGQGHLGLELAQRGHRVRFTDCADSMAYIIGARRYLLRPEHRRNAGGFTPGLAHEVLPGLPQHDVVVCQEVLEHVPDYMLQATCDALLGAAKVGLVVSVPDATEDLWGPHVRTWSDEMLRQYLGGGVEIRRDQWCMAIVRRP